MKKSIKKYFSRAIICLAILVSLIAQAHTMLIMVDNQTNKTASVVFRYSKYGQAVKSVLSFEAKGISFFGYGAVYLPDDAIIESVKIGEIECSAGKDMRLPYKMEEGRAVKLRITNKTSLVLPHDLKDVEEIKACSVSLIDSLNSSDM